VRVAVDGRSLGGSARGIAQYLTGMLGALDDDLELRVVLPRGARLPVARDNVVAVHHPAPSRVLYGSAALTGRPRLDRLAGVADVVWLPAPAPVAVGDVPSVLTVHDLNFLERPRQYTPYERIWHRLARPRALVEQAARVVTNTADVGAEVRARFGVDAIVVPAGPGDPGPAVGPEEIEAVRARHGLPERYFLFVGALEPRKAPDLLVVAHRLAGGADLVFAGEGRLASELRGPGVHVLRRVSREDKAALYAGALAVVLPSWSEGYGYPPLEGYAHGTPAIVSDLPALRETAGDGALYFPPGGVGSLVGVLKEVANDDGLRARLAAAGRAALAARSWETGGRALSAVLREAA
jgi:glycosyltransferase involved in cell wall biosynthesis